MQINEIDIVDYDATLIERHMSNHEIVSIEDWLEGSPAPIFHREYDRYKNITLVILIESINDEEAEEKFDRLINDMRLCTIKFDDMSKLYDCKYSGQTEPEKLYNGIWKVTFELMAYRTYKPETVVNANKVATTILMNDGTLATECVIEVTPTTALTAFTITGLSETPITVRNLSQGVIHVIDGYKFKYLKDGVNDIGNYDSFEFPVLQAGRNNITFSTATANIKVRFFQKFN